ncbi:hypothetical protein GDO81_009092 [Engystomops pustulosus]|uniref:Uncharacterized protein n=1 Tax=Engystomops pustulosus TaxID=76066 RepID=A0AAV7BNL2_ENGPU|nr:hypothetical protein GDO81_009092 [Engystomops pustulosus]
MLRTMNASSNVHKQGLCIHCFRFRAPSLNDLPYRPRWRHHTVRSVYRLLGVYITLYTPYSDIYTRHVLGAGRALLWLWRLVLFVP